MMINKILNKFSNAPKQVSQERLNRTEVQDLLGKMYRQGVDATFIAEEAVENIVGDAALPHVRRLLVNLINIARPKGKSMEDVRMQIFGSSYVFLCDALKDTDSAKLFAPENEKFASAIRFRLAHYLLSEKQEKVAA